MPQKSALLDCQLCSTYVVGLSTTVMSTVCVYLPSTHMAILEGTQ